MKKMALVHEWLVTYGGSEGVVSAILDIWPHVPIYTLVYDPTGPCREFVQNREIHTSLIQRLPRSTKKHQTYLFLMPYAIEQFDLDEFDVIISSSHAVAKGVITNANQIHISYIHSPIRYAWDMYHQYLYYSQLHGIRGLIARLLLHYIRIWDMRTVNTVDHFIANSNYIASRIWKLYKRKSSVIYPPVDISEFQLMERKESYYLVVSRLAPYKRIDLIIEAFNRMPDKKLIVIGDGQGYGYLKKMGKANITFLGFQPRDVVVEFMQNSKALVFAAEEDFGIVPVEAQACGTPVIAYGRGGVLETVKNKETGLFFFNQTSASLEQAVVDFENGSKNLNIIQMRKNAEKFSKERFMKEIKDYVDFIVENSTASRGDFIIPG